ncbi:hypothetical protein IT575_03555 [bacterium]|nr:hypothetical protein [bacterium]
MRAVLPVLLFLAVWLGLSGCGSSNSSPFGPAADPALSALQGPAPQRSALPVQPQFKGLPALSQLEGLRSASISGPGWLDIAASLSLRSAQCTSQPDGDLAMQPGVAEAFAVFGAFGFDGDSFSTGLKVSLEAPAGPYFVAYSDYIAGRWVFAGPFNGDAEVEIPNITPYTDPRAYCASDGTHYFALIAPEAPGIVLRKLELGVSGGDDAPLPPLSLLPISGDNGAVAWLNASPSQSDPDFAGYIIERAPLLSGPFTRVTTEVYPGLQFHDPDAVSGEAYRWRAAAVDSSGNQSIWLTTSSGISSGSSLPPVIRMKLPYGRYYAPYDLKLDFGDCFDPDGDAITAYAAAGIYGVSPVSGSDPLLTLTLPAGCHRIAVQVLDSSGSFSRQSFEVKVYPRWESSSVVVREPEQNLSTLIPRLFKPQIVRNPATGLLSIVGYDISQAMFSVYQQQSDGSFVQERVLVPVSNQASNLVLIWDPLANGGKGEGEFMDVANPGALSSPAPPPFAPCALAEDGGGNAWLFFTVVDGPDINVRASRLGLLSGALSMITDPVPGIGSLTAIDAEFNPVTERIELALSLPVGTLNYEFNPLDGTVGPSSVISPDTLALGGLDLEVNPDSGRAAVVYYTTLPSARCRFSERNDAAVWSSPLVVDDSADNGQECRLEFLSDGTALCLTRANSGDQVSLHQVSTAGSSPVSAPAQMKSDYGYFQFCPSGPAQVMVICEDLNNSFNVLGLDLGGGDSPVTQIVSIEGQGQNLQAVFGGDGLHAMWTSYAYLTRHMSSADTQTWVQEVDETYVPYFDLGSGKDGEVLITAASAIGHGLSSWDQVARSFNGELLASGQPEHHPILSDDPTSDTHVWLHYDDSIPGDLQIATGSTGTFSSYSTSPDLLPLWDGAVTGSDEFFNFYSFSNGGGLLGPNVGYTSWMENGTNNNWAFPPPGNPPNDPMTSDSVRGQSFATAWCLGGAAPGLIFSLVSSYDQVYYTSMGNTTSPQRYLFPDVNGDHSSIIPFESDLSDFYRQELRRTVSAYTVAGPTAVAVITSLDGREQYLEWSDFGKFEELPLPGGLGSINRAVITAGVDGRWHLIYHDPASDRVLCRSTL